VFAELERGVQGKPERQVGEVVVAAEGPEWRPIVEKATALLGQSKDLRIGVYLARGALEVQGFSGFADGLTLLRRTVEEFWPTCHPQLDADDGNDPTLRVNAMEGLVARDMINALRAAPLVKSKAFGDIRLRDIESAAVKRPDGTTGAANLDASFLDVPAPALILATQTLERCVTEAKGLEEVWNTHLDSGGPNLTDLRRVLFQAQEALRARVAALAPAGADAAATNGTADATNGAAASGPPSVSGGGLRGEPRSRDDVMKALDAIIAYYGRYEPSSPVPLLLERCKRLVTMSFMDIVRDMLPDGVSNIETIAGKPKE
jgi:type VI secretion system protein ImpA